MKIIYAILVILLLSCGTTDPLQGVWEKVKLVKVGTITRYSGTKTVLYWKTERGIIYQTDCINGEIPPLGSVATVIIR